MRATWIIVGSAMLCGALGATLLARGPAGTSAGDQAPLSATPEVVCASAFGTGPARFEPNVGQVPADVRWLRRGPGHTTWVLDDGFTTVVRPRDAGPAKGAAVADVVGHAVRVRFTDAAPSPSFVPGAALVSKTHYFQGSDPQRWIHGVPHHAEVRAHDVWPGIDVVYRGREGRLTYDFLVAPGADPSRIAFLVQGADDVRLDASGDLVVAAGIAEIRHRRPLVYEETPSGRRPIGARFALGADGRVGFRVDRRDASLPLVIDPTEEIRLRIGTAAVEDGIAIAAGPDGGAAPYLFAIGGTVYSSFGNPFPLALGPLGRDTFGGAAAVFVGAFSDEDTLSWMAVIDSTGDDGLAHLRAAADGVHCVGWTNGATTFPAVNGIQGTGLGGYDGTYFRVLGDGTALGTSGRFGGTATDLLTGIDVAADPETGATTAVYIAGLTYSASVPYLGTPLGDTDGFVLQVKTGGSGVAGRRVGGSGDDLSGPGLVEFAGNTVNVAFTISSTDAPTTAGVHQESNPSAVASGYLAQFDRDLATFHNGTYFGSAERPLTVTGVASDERSAGAGKRGRSSPRLRPTLGFVVDEGNVFAFPSLLERWGRPSYADTVLTSFGDPDDVTLRGIVFAGTPDALRISITGTTAFGVPPLGGGLPAPGGGDAFVASGEAADPFAWDFTTNLGAFALQHPGAIGYVDNRLFSVGRPLDALPDGRLLLIGQTWAPTDSWAELSLIGPGGGARDLFVRSVTSTVASTAATPIEGLRIASGTIIDSERAGADRVTLRCTAAAGTFSGAVAEKLATEWLDVTVHSEDEDAPRTADIDLPPTNWQVYDWLVNLHARDSLRQQGVKPPLKAAASGRFDAKIDTKRSIVTVALSGADLDAAPAEGPLVVTIDLGAYRGQTEARLQRKGRKFVVVPPRTGVVADLVVGAPTAVAGRPVTVRGRLRNYDDAPAQRTVELRAGKSVLASGTVAVGARPGEVRLPAFASLATQFTPEKAGRVTLEMRVDGKRAAKVRLRVTPAE